MFDDSLHHNPGDSKQSIRKESLKNEILFVCNSGQDSLEQYTRKQSLEICGILASAYASSEVAVLKIASALDVTMPPQDVNISHRVKSHEICTVLVKFQSHKGD